MLGLGFFASFTAVSAADVDACSTGFFELDELGSGFCWLLGELASSLFDWLLGWLLGWFFGWLLGCFVAWFVAWFLACWLNWVLGSGCAKPNRGASAANEAPSPPAAASNWLRLSCASAGIWIV